MNSHEALLQSFDKSLDDPFESLGYALKDLSEAESSWQHPAYRKEPHDQGVGVPGTILWHINHLELCHRHYTATIANPDPEHPPKTQPAGEMNLSDTLSALESANVELRNAISSLTPDDLSRLVRPSNDLADFIAMIIRHVVWHASQITMIRRLYTFEAGKH